MLLEALGVLIVLALIFTLFIRPGAVAAIVLAVGVVCAAIVVSWHDVEQVRTDRAANAALQQQQNASATVPAPNYPRAGS